MPLPTVLGAAVSHVTCKAGNDWMNNGLGQDPCVVYAYLSATCSPTANWTVDPLSGDPRATYNPPAGQLISQCQCSTVLYSLLQACSSCQACSILSWGAWSSGCPSTYIGKTYPYAIPSGTQIPGWAYLDVTASGDGSGWNETAAEQYALSGSTSLDPSTQTTHSGPNIKLIVGVVVGVIGGTVLLVLLWLWWCAHRGARRQRELSLYSVDADGQRITYAPGYAGPTTTVNGKPIGRPMTLAQGHSYSGVPPLPPVNGTATPGRRRTGFLRPGSYDWRNSQFVQSLHSWRGSRGG